MSTRKDGERRGNTPIRQFRLGEDVVEKLDAIATHLGRESGNPHTRSDAVRVAIQRMWVSVCKGRTPEAKGGGE